MTMDPIITDDDVAALRAILARIQASRPAGRGRALTLHHAVEDGLGGVIAAGQGILSCERDFRDAAAGVRKAVLDGDRD